MKLYRESIWREIVSSYESDSLAPSLLFSGPESSGRLSLALDLASFLGIDDIIFFPERNLGLQIEAAYNLLLEKYSSRFISYFISRIKILLMQYHPALQSDGSEGGRDKLFSAAADISELLFELERLDAERRRDEVLRISESIYNASMRPDLLYRGKKKGSLSVDEVRAVQNYLVRKSGKAMVIIENIENSNDSVRNALLKVLEEPYKESYFVLISSNSLRILTTILSRLRKYSFSPLPDKELNLYLRENFLTSKDYDSFNDFVFEMCTDEKDRMKITESARMFSSSLISGDYPGIDELDDIFSSLEKNRPYFISMVLKDLRRSFSDGHLKAAKAYSIVKALDDASLSNEVYNQNMRSALDLALREAGFVG